MSDAPPRPAPTPLPPLRPERRGMPAWLPLLVVLAAWVAQAGVLWNGWVWDDAIVVRDDPAIASGIRSVPRMLAAPWAGKDRDVGLFRPLVSATLAIEASLHGTKDPFGFHLTNLFLHGLAAVLLLRVLSRAMPDRPWVSGAAAVLFAAHPLHTGTVSWIVARGDVLVVVFGALGALAWVRGRSLDAGSAALAGLAWFGALLSKEAALPLPLAWLVLDLAVRREGLRATVARRWAAYAALILPLAGWWLLRTQALGEFDARSDNALLADRNVLERLFVGCGALVRTAARLFVPAVPSGEGSPDPVLVPGADVPAGYAIAAAFVLLATVAVILRAATRRAGAIDAAWGLFVALSVPVLQIVPLGAVFEDRFAYVPSTALLVVAGLAAAAIVRRVPRAVATAGAVVVLGLASAASWAVAADWRDDTAFYRALLREEPEHLRALTGLARSLLISARDARREAQTLRVEPETQARRDAAIARWGRDARDAVAVLERARALPHGRTSEVFRLLGDAYLRLPDAQYGAADGAYKQALDRVRVRMRGKRVPQASVKPSELSRVSPRDRREMGELHANRGLARLGQSETDKAIGSYRASALWHPGDYEVQHTLGALLMRAGGLSDALPHLEIAAQLAPPADADRVQRDLVAAGRLIRERSQTLYEEAGDAYERGDRERALARYQDAIEVRKNFAEAWLRAGMLLARYRGNLRDAATYVQQAVAILDEERARSTRPEAADAARLRAEAEAGLREIEGMRDAPDEPGPPKEPVVPK